MKVFCETIRLNRPKVDLLDVDIDEITPKFLFERRGKPDVSLFVGGPPCQSFSSGGKRAGLSDPRGNLIYTYLAFIEAIRPRFFVLENVANIVTAALKHRPISQRPGKRWSLKHYENNIIDYNDGAPPMCEDEMSGSAIRQIIDDAGKLGYHITFAVVNSADYGAPQLRYRFVMIGARDCNSVPINPPLYGPNSKKQRPWQVVRDAIYDIKDHPGAHSEYTPEVAQYFSLVPPGGNWRDLPKDLQQQALDEASYNAGGGKTGFFRRLSWNKPSPTITGKPNRKGSALCHPEYTRPLSVRECARLQGFPDEWKFAGAMNNQYAQVGNAVPVQLGEAIGKALKKMMRNQIPKTSQDTQEIEYMLKMAKETLRATAKNFRSRTNQPLLF